MTGAAMVFWVRELPIRRRTQAIDALRGYLAEFGEVMPKGASNAARLVAILEDPTGGLPEEARTTLPVLTEAKTRLDERIIKLDAEIRRRAGENEVARRVRTIPGVGPLIATALVALAPHPETFRLGRDFAAWLGLVPRRHSAGGKQRLGAATRMGERALRRSPIIGARGVVIKRHVHRTARPGTWRARMPSRKPAMLVRVAPANNAPLCAIGSRTMARARIVRAFAIGLERMAANGSLARGRVYQSAVAAA